MERDQEIFDLIEQEHQRQLRGMELIASEKFESSKGKFDTYYLYKRK